MKREVIVLSLGGSLIIPEEINLSYLEKFKKVILKHIKKYKFIVVCGGGSIARKYIHALRETGKNEVLQSFAGISATRMNARFMSYFFDSDQEYGIPSTMETLHKYLKEKDIVFCGALEYHPNQTSDSTAAQIAEEFNAKFINITNVPGLHNKNPLTHKDAKHIPKISWEAFDKMANKMKFSPGQHFVLDQKASKIIKKEKIITYIIGKETKQLDNLLRGKKYKGTIIRG